MQFKSCDRREREREREGVLNGIDSFHITFKESGRIRRRFGRNVGILKRLKNFTRFVRVSNAIRVIVFLSTGKLVKFPKIYFVFSKYDSD